MTDTTEHFLSVCEAALRETKVPLSTVVRLVRMGRRLQAIEVKLRFDPGHSVTAAVVEPTQNRTKSVSDWIAMGRATLASTGPFEPGVCRVCGCTESTACAIEVPGHGKGSETTCGWASVEKTLCDNPECVRAFEVSGG